MGGGREPAESSIRFGGTKGMVKARVALVTELLEDIVRAPRSESLEALSWRHPFALSHFLEGVHERCPRRTLGKLCPQQGVAGRQMRPSPFAGKEKTKASPPCGEGSLQAKAFPLAGRKYRTREGSGPVPKDETSRRVAGGSCRDLRFHPREHT